MASIGRMVKESAVQELSTRLSERSNVLVTAINRLPATEADNLRKKLHGSQARLLIVKRTLGKRALDQLHLADVTALFEGSVGLVLAGDDVLAAAKTIVEFVKTHEDQLTVRGGRVDGMLLDRGRVEQLANLPPKPMLLAQVVLTIESPLADLIFTTERLIGDLIWAVDQAAAKKPLPAAPGSGSTGAAQAGLPAHEDKGQAGAEPAPTAASEAASAAPAAPPATPPTTEEQGRPSGEQPTTQEGTPS